MPQQNINDLKEPEEGGQNYNQIRRFIDDLKNKDITHHNFRNLIPEIKSNIQIIQSQIESHQLQVRKAYKERNKVIEKHGEDRIQSLADGDNIVPAALYDATYNVQHHIKEMYAWQTINTEVEHIVNRKLVRALLNVADYEVESKVVERVSDLHSQMMNQSKDMVTNLVQQQNNKIDSLKESMSERTELLMQKNLNELREIQRLQNEGMRGLVEFVGELFSKQAQASQGSGGGGLSPDDLERALEKKFKGLRRELSRDYSAHVDEARVPDKDRYRQVEQDSGGDGMNYPSSADELAADEDGDDSSLYGEESVPEDSSQEGDDFSCPYCDASFSDDLMLDTHIDVQHEDELEG